jgi:hypothetical protein
MGARRVESFCAAANIFVSQAKAPMDELANELMVDIELEI